MLAGMPPAETGCSHPPGTAPTSHNHCVIQDVCGCLCVHLPGGFWVGRLHCSSCPRRCNPAAPAAPPNIRPRERPVSLQHSVVLFVSMFVTNWQNQPDPWGRMHEIVALVLLDARLASKSATAVVRSVNVGRSCPASHNFSAFTHFAVFPHGWSNIQLASCHTAHRTTTKEASCSLV